MPKPPISLDPKAVPGLDWHEGGTIRILHAANNLLACVGRFGEGTFYVPYPFWAKVDEELWLEHRIKSYDYWVDADGLWDKRLRYPILGSLILAWRRDLLRKPGHYSGVLKGCNVVVGAFDKVYLILNQEPFAISVAIGNTHDLKRRKEVFGDAPDPRLDELFPLLPWYRDVVHQLPGGETVRVGIMSGDGASDE